MGRRINLTVGGRDGRACGSRFECIGIAAPVFARKEEGNGTRADVRTRAEIVIFDDDVARSHSAKHIRKSVGILLTIGVCDRNGSRDVVHALSVLLGKRHQSALSAMFTALEYDLGIGAAIRAKNRFDVEKGTRDHKRRRVPCA